MGLKVHHKNIASRLGQKRVEIAPFRIAEHKKRPQKAQPIPLFTLNPFFSDGGGIFFILNALYVA